VSPADESGAAAPDVADVADGATRQAERLLRWYPRPWRDRYGAEFTELLLSDISERPQSLRRSLDVARGGVLARLANAGLAGFPLPAATAGGPAGTLAQLARQRQISASLGSLSCGLGAFLVFAAALWSQILISWQWSARLNVSLPARSLPPLARAPGRSAFFAVFTTDVMLALLGLAVFAALPVLATVVSRVARDRQARLIRPAVVLAASLSVLVAGGRHFENNWLGTGGHHALVPSGLAAFIWAVTLFVSAYWAHPAMFATLPADERAWMAVSPIAVAVAVASGAVLLRRARLSPRVAAFEACLGLLACVAMTAFVVCYGVWITERVRLEPGLPVGLSVGATNATIIAFLVLALAVAAQAARMAVRGLRRARG
jgi:hypothetical protein